MSQPHVRKLVTSALRVAFVAVMAAIPAAPPALGNEPPTDAAMAFPAGGFLTQRETWAAAAVLLFGFAMAMVATHLIRAKTLPASEAIRLVALILIVTGTLFLVTAGYSAEQIAPALGLLGTVAGYLLGRSERDKQRGRGTRKPDDAQES